MYAESAVKMISAFAANIGIGATYLLRGDYLDCFDITGTGSHKYIPADRLTEQLGLPQGAGVFGYVHFTDGSYALKLCNDHLAYWSGNDEDLPIMV